MNSHSVFPRLFSPVQVGPRELRNRVVITAHGACEWFRRPGSSAEPYIEYLRRRAAAGVALIICQPLLSEPGVTVAPEVEDRHGRLAEAIRAEGAVALLQLVHLGAFGRTDSDVRRRPLPGFQYTQSAAGETAHQMSRHEIEAMIECYRATARMAASVGFDGVEIHGAHGYLVQQSLTPAFNDRDDEWGRERTLFARRLLEVARAEIGPTRILSYRTATDDLRAVEDGGLGVAGIAAVLSRLLASGHIDMLNTTIGDGGLSYARAIPDYRYGEAPNIPAVARLRRTITINIPVVGVGRIASPAAAESVLASGACDLVAMTRAHIADPDLLAKVRRGETHRIRPCVGANVCVNRKLQGYEQISCFHNPEVLREDELAVRPARKPRRIVVVGAGPAGLKAAETAAKRAYQVTIVDSGSAPGGQLRAAQHTAASGLVSAVDYLVSELAEHGIAVRTGTTADENLLVDLRPGHLVVATGAPTVPAQKYPDAAPGVVISPADALAAAEALGRVVVFDAVGANEGALVAEALTRRSEVMFVTACETVMPWGGALHRYEVLPILRRRCTSLITGGLIGDLTGHHVVVVRSDGETLAELDVDHVVPVVASIPNTDVAGIAARMGIPHTVVGDALAPRTAMHAFKEGHEAIVALC
jgi:2,4-dienoyl-CoA reductase-like NADH-dependent reductase (Old Yellow Enzyme family)